MYCKTVQHFELKDALVKSAYYVEQHIIFNLVL